MTWTVAKTITVEEVVDNFGRLGVPHFQRGRVWGPSGISALLESLFYNTPCGSFVFWDSGDNATNGEPLDEASADVPAYLVIDGQQRIRSLAEAFKNSPVDADEPTDGSAPTDDQRGPKLWCINLTELSGTCGWLRARARRFPLFVYAADPRLASPRSPLRENILPLREIIEGEAWDGIASLHKVFTFGKGLSREDGLGRLAAYYPTLRERVMAIQAREFFVAARDSAHTLAEMAALYNRINAGGKQVEIEERAFATLVGLQTSNTSVSDGLRAVFSLIHPHERVIAGRDAFLKREEERAFGFKLFIRVFLQVCQHHFGYRQGRSSFSFDLVGRDDFREAFQARTQEEVTWLWNETARVVRHVREALLCESLHCDDLRMLPETGALMPVLQLLIQYPDLEREMYRPLLASLCLRLALADMGGVKLLKLVADAGDPTQLAFAVIPRLLKTARSEVSARLTQGLEDANSMQDRYVLLLYWLERHLGARDFLYEHVKNQKKTLTPPEALLARAVKPEKQHLVPIAKSVRAPRHREQLFHGIVITHSSAS